MGKIKEIIASRAIPTPAFNNRLTVELCENVHLHYRNIRLEFDKNEFLILLEALKQLDTDKIDKFQYGTDKFEPLIEANILPDATEWNDRLQIEEQVEGHYHLHYRNLRIEINDLEEIGCEK